MEKHRETQIVSAGSEVKGKMSVPEIMPVYLTTAFGGSDLDTLEDYYREKGYTYNRIRNPNRNALAELISYLENGEASIICSSGMAAISTTLLGLLEKGDHVVASKSLYGESLDFLHMLAKYGIEVTNADFNDMQKVRNATRSTTKIFYTETISNPLMTVVDIDAIADIAHSCNAKMVVDNTFATSFIFKPLEHGTDISINSLTKFANGHSDVVGGSITASRAIIDGLSHLQFLLGCTMDPFASYMCQRGMRTMDLRIKKQAENAAALADALASNPYVLKVNYPSLKSHPQHKLAAKMFSNGYGAMLSFEMPENRKKINNFMQNLNIAHYAMTLGGYSTTLSYPVLSSHFQFSRDERLKMGITDGLMRVSVGIENVNDLIGDFTQALEVFA